MTSRKLPDIFFRFYQNLDFLEKFSRKSSVSNFTEVRPMETKLIDADRQTVKQTEKQMTDTKKLIGIFCEYAKAP